MANCNACINTLNSIAQEEEAKKKREEVENRKQKPPRPANAARPPKAPSNKGEEAEGDKVHDEEDMKIIKDALGQGGYCYFNRKLSEKEQSLLDEEQKKLRAVSSKLLCIRVWSVIERRGDAIYGSILSIYYYT